MNTITGYYIKYDNNLQEISREPHSIEASIGDRVVFVDNSGISNCYINTVGLKNGEWATVYPAGTQGDTTPPKQGRIVKTDSIQTTGIRKSFNAELTMPIAVICDDGIILYCNPLNIMLIEQQQ